MEDKTEEKVVFKCNHCDNDDMKHFSFNSLEYQSDGVKNSPYKQNWTRETSPKIPLGFHVRCAKCNKDTFFIPSDYQPTMWGNDVPQSCIVNVKFEKPPFSAINYVLTEEGFLDQVVLMANNEKLSMITKKIINDSNKFSVIGKSQYELLLKRGLKEVGEVVVSQPANQKQNNNKGDKNER